MFVFHVHDWKYTVFNSINWKDKDEFIKLTEYLLPKLNEYNWRATVIGKQNVSHVHFYL